MIHPGQRKKVFIAHQLERQNKSRTCAWPAKQLIKWLDARARTLCGDAARVRGRRPIHWRSWLKNSTNFACVAQLSHNRSWRNFLSVGAPVNQPTSMRPPQPLRLLMHEDGAWDCQSNMGRSALESPPPVREKTARLTNRQHRCKVRQFPVARAPKLNQTRPASVLLGRI